MIKWDEPIQAIDGRHARVIAHLLETPGDPNDPGFFTPTMVWISSATNGFGAKVFDFSELFTNEVYFNELSLTWILLTKGKMTCSNPLVIE